MPAQITRPLLIGCLVFLSSDLPLVFFFPPFESCLFQVQFDAVAPRRNVTILVRSAPQSPTAVQSRQQPTMVFLSYFQPGTVSLVKPLF